MHMIRKGQMVGSEMEGIGSDIPKFAAEPALSVILSLDFAINPDV